MIWLVRTLRLEISMISARFSFWRRCIFAYTDAGTSGTLYAESCCLLSEEQPVIANTQSNNRSVDFMFIASPAIYPSQEPSFPDVTNQARRPCHRFRA